MVYGLFLILSFGLVGSVLSDGRGGRHRPRQGRTNFNDGGIFTNGFHTDNAEFGNQYSAQNVQPSYGSQPQYASGGGQPQYANGGGGGQPQYASGGGQAQYGAASDENIEMLEKAVPGVPGEDYPIYAEVPDTSFSCDGQVDGGYYADPEAECQVFHICTADGAGGLTQYSFLCPNGTVFSQQYFICDWWFNFDCSEAEAFYSLNDALAEERQAATDALLQSASGGQPSYASPAASNYGASSASNGYSASPPRRQNGRKKSKGNGRKKGNRGSQSASNNYGASQANRGYSSPTSQSAPASNNYGSAASTGYAAPATSNSNNYGAPSQAPSTSYGSPSASYGAPASPSSNYGSPDYDYDSLPSYGKKKR